MLMTVAPTTAKGSPARVFQPATPFVFASADETLVARGSARALRVQPGTLATEVGQFLADRAEYGDAPVLVGALPFDWRRDPHLFEPKSIVLTRGRAAARREPPAALSHGSASYGISAAPTRREYERAVALALERMTPNGSGADPLGQALADHHASHHAGHHAGYAALRKVVLARTLTLESSAAFDPAAIVARLREDRGVTAFSVPLPLPDAASVLVGATPELLIRREGMTVTSMPLAGSARRGADERSDAAAAEALVNSAKDLREHAVVVEWIADRLSPYCKSLRVSQKPSLAATRSLWHLATRIQGRLHDESVSSVELAAALHPTPAVCGEPVDLAQATIQELEPFDRGFFAGAVGWCAANGDGAWMVAIRCAELSGHTARLFAGAGIVPGSIPRSEADETFAKFGALLDALSFDDRNALLREEDR
jgi:isochorismate synthase